jgi:hypothetical protein
MNTQRTEMKVMKIKTTKLLPLIAGAPLGLLSSPPLNGPVLVGKAGEVVVVTLAADFWTLPKNKLMSKGKKGFKTYTRLFISIHQSPAALPDRPELILPLAP